MSDRAGTPQAAEGRNRLVDEASPYLLQHAHNPVDWWPWCAEALAAAKAQNKPILLSVGYAACHWCHVMAHESFEDDATAAVMNARFINIKVDREERPDIDQIYMSALHATGEQGGWPLTMFLTSAAEPFFGGTYFPKNARFGRPAFVDVLNAVADAYEQKADAVANNVAALKQRLGGREAPGELPSNAPDLAASQLAAIMDPVHGGTKGAPKFPNAALFECLWRSAARAGNQEHSALVVRSLNRIAMGGITDHLGGGLARYSVDHRWLVPHFEKMLYDNAQILALYADAHGMTGNPLFAVRSREIVAWLEREMAVDGLYASSLDADSEGEEGRFYVWTKAEVDAVLGSEADAFNERYDVTEGGNWEGVTILNRLADEGLSDDATEAFLSRCRAALLAHREERVRPGRDDKLLADWNGLTIAALARAGAAFGEAEWIDRALDAFRRARHRFGRGDRLIHAVRGEASVETGFALDYAAMIKAALALHRVGRTDPLDAALGWLDVLETHFVADHGGYYWTSDDGEALIVRPDSPLDEAVPNANGLMVENAATLWAITGEDRFETIARRILTAHARTAAGSVFGCASLFNGMDQLSAPTVTLSDAPALMTSLLEAGHPAAVPLWEPPGDHPSAGAVPAGHAVICRAGACSLPMDQSDPLRAALWTATV